MRSVEPLGNAQVSTVVSAVTGNGSTNPVLNPKFPEWLTTSTRPFSPAAVARRRPWALGGWREFDRGFSELNLSSPWLNRA